MVVYFYYFTSVTYYSLFFQYMFPWGQESVDSITLRSDLHKCIGTDEFRGLPFNKKSIPHVIQVKTDLNRGNSSWFAILLWPFSCFWLLLVSLEFFCIPTLPPKKKKNIYILLYNNNDDDVSRPRAVPPPQLPLWILDGNPKTCITFLSRREDSLCKKDQTQAVFLLIVSVVCHVCVSNISIQENGFHNFILLHHNFFNFKDFSLLWWTHIQKRKDLIPVAKLVSAQFFICILSWPLSKLLFFPNTLNIMSSVK